MATAEKPVTAEKIPGTTVPDVQKVQTADQRERRWMSWVAVSTAIMAAMAAISSSLSAGNLNEGMIEQVLASDQWSYYQAKGVKSAIVESRIDAAKDAGQAPSPGDTDRFDRYQKEQKDIFDKAKGHEAEATRHRRMYKLLARAATCEQIGIGVAAVALLLRKNVFSGLVLIAGTAGAAIMAYAFLAAP